MANINTGILNNYSIRPKNLTQYNAFRGVIDFSQIGQFDPYETGYSFLTVLKMPRFMTMLAEQDSNVAKMVDSMEHLLQFEFRGITGLPDTTADTLELGDGVNTVNIIRNVTRDTSVTVNTAYYERSGSLITRFMEYYLTGIKDPMSKAKTYHGLIKNGLLEPNIENEVFTFMYYVTDSTMLRLEKAWLLCDVQPIKAETSMYDSTKGDIDRKELSIDWNCFPVTGYEVDKAASVLLTDITGVSVTQDSAGNATYSVTKTEGVAALDSSNYKYGVMDSTSPSAINKLTDASSRATNE